jgi:esterase/lipase superfamily enzyme
MTNDEMKDSLHKGICKVVFTKKNGDERIMHCTLQESMLPEQVDVEELIQKKKPNPDVLAVWDVEAKGWRSFRWDTIKDFSTEFNL